MFDNWSNHNLPAFLANVNFVIDVKPGFYHDGCGYSHPCRSASALDLAQHAGKPRLSNKTRNPRLWRRELLFAERQRGAHSSVSENTALAACDLAYARPGSSLTLGERSA